jgi:hypothetical protein
MQAPTLIEINTQFKHELTVMELRYPKLLVENNLKEGEIFKNVLTVDQGVDHHVLNYTDEEKFSITLKLLIQKTYEYSAKLCQLQKIQKN